MKNITLERTTSQKKIILDYLKSVTTHPSANVVYNAVRKNLPHISRGTVYRVLNNLRRKGEIQAISTKDTTFFDGDMSDHAHFICTDCGKIYDVFDECSKCGILKKRKLKVGKIKNYKVQFYGTCKKCQ
ncbi:MAG: transcriptional repressor [Candidatus Nealsonbacteria bacterium]|nr:transcriptional repressor [Candidatus Nealsonbacteria bacterium]